MKAMILAAGLGTRLSPFTDHKPKALVPLAGKPMLEWVIQRLIHFGFDELVINVHHFADQIEQFLRENDNFGLRIAISDERDHLLETGGGLKKAAPLLEGPESFLVCNADVMTDLNLSELMAAHHKSGALATLAVQDRKTSRYLLFDSAWRLWGWKNTQTGELRPPVLPSLPLMPLAFSGVQVIKPEMLGLIRREGKFSLIDAYLDLMESHKIMGFGHTEGYWKDLGKVENIREIEKDWEKLRLFG